MNLKRSILIVCCISFLLHGSATAQPLPSYAQYFRYVFDIPDQYINDHCLIYAQNEWHLFFIQGTISTLQWSRDGNEVIIGHATSSDLIHWQLQPPALSTGLTGSLDAGHVYAPSVIERDGTYYMVYAGSEKHFSEGEHLFLATSTDLFTWSRYSSDPIFSPDSSWASYFPFGYNNGSGGPASCRDPHIIKDDRYGFICYYVARLKGDPTRPSADQEYACVAVATSPDLIQWIDRGPVLTRRIVGDDSNPYAHPESPCVIKRNGAYYLFWKGGSGTRYVISSNPFDFQDRSEYFLATSHASEIFEWNSQWYITSCSRELDDVTHSYSDRKRGLFLAQLVWNGKYPSVTSLPFTSSVEETRSSHGEIHPNPVPHGMYTYLNAPLSSGNQAPTVSIVDMMGRIIRVTTSPEATIDVSGNTKLKISTDGIAPGLYFVTAGKGSPSVKLIVQ